MALGRRRGQFAGERDPGGFPRGALVGQAGPDPLREPLDGVAVVRESTPTNCAQVAPYYLCVADVLLPLQPHCSEPDVLVPVTCMARGS